MLVVAFLRGSLADPPPENWFTKAETWKKKIREEGLYVTVPQGAEQVLRKHYGNRWRLEHSAQLLYAGCPGALAALRKRCTKPASIEPGWIPIWPV